MGLACAVGLATVAGPVLAGGYDTGERDWDFVFQQDKVAFEAGTRYIVPKRHLTGTGFDVDETEAFSVHRLSVAGRIADHLRCMASYREPFEGHADYGSSWIHADSAIEQHFTSKDYGATCVVTAQLGMGQIGVLAGISYQEIAYELTQFNVIPLSTNMGDDGVGWRGGITYEIPEYALRASLILNSAIDYDLTGTATAAGGAAYGSITMPKSLELRAQSGVAPGWLAFGSINWTDWSVAENTPICPVGVTPCTLAGAKSGLALYFRDTWTVTLGAAHQLSDMVSLAGNVTWAQGASHGFTSQTDVYSAGLLAIVTPTSNTEIKLGGTIGILTAGSLSTMSLGGVPNPVGYTASFDNDLVLSLQASGALHF